MNPLSISNEATGEEIVLNVKEEELIPLTQKEIEDLIDDK
jgi:hypothetical protein